jgi:hypothetical protein
MGRHRSTCCRATLSKMPIPNGRRGTFWVDTSAVLAARYCMQTGADLIGQLADPFYPRKLNALFYEFEEIGCNAQLGYAGPADVADQHPRFFWSKVEPFIGDALNYLELTVEGRQWMANLYCNVFEIEHGRRRMGPHNRRA